jgi:polyhydroxyalkanoate synthesis regulator phasin
MHTESGIEKLARKALAGELKKLQTQIDQLKKRVAKLEAKRA